MGGLRRRLHYSFFGPRAKKRQRRRLRPPIPPAQRESQASPLICAHPSPQFNGRSSTSADKRGVWGRSDRRRLAAGQPAVRERSPPSKTKPLRVGRLLAPGANVQIKACGPNPACAQFNGPAYNSTARTSTDLSPIRPRGHGHHDHAMPRRANNVGRSFQLIISSKSCPPDDPACIRLPNRFHFRHCHQPKRGAPHGWITRKPYQSVSISHRTTPLRA